MVLAYLQSVLLCGHSGLLHNDGNIFGPAFLFRCQAPHLDGRRDFVNVLRIILRRHGKRRS